jgi:hypothetical protein
MPRKTRSSLSASEDMISLQRYPKKYAVTLDKQDYNARVLAKYWMGKEPSETMIPHSRRAVSDKEFGTVLQRIKGTPAAAYYTGSGRKRSPSPSASAYDWSPAGVPVVRSTAARRRGPGAEQSVVPRRRR